MTCESASFVFSPVVEEMIGVSRSWLIVFLECPALICYPLPNVKHSALVVRYVYDRPLLVNGVMYEGPIPASLHAVWN